MVCMFAVGGGHYCC